eukprot:1158255-Pelagomonas_calceolata.AAC.2
MPAAPDAAAVPVKQAVMESMVRRKADPAKEALQVFVKRWRDDPKVQQHPSHESIKGEESWILES